MIRETVKKDLFIILHINISKVAKIEKLSVVSETICKNKMDLTDSYYNINKYFYCLIYSAAFVLDIEFYLYLLYSDYVKNIFFLFKYKLI